VALWALANLFISIIIVYGLKGPCPSQTLWARRIYLNILVLMGTAVNPTLPVLARAVLSSIRESCSDIVVASTRESCSKGLMGLGAIARRLFR
jgi:hypothetical protein